MNKNELNQRLELFNQIVDELNLKIEEFSTNSQNILMSINNLQMIFDKIRGIPSEVKIEIEKLKKIRMDWSNEIQASMLVNKVSMVSQVTSGVASGIVSKVFIGNSIALGLAGPAGWLIMGGTLLGNGLSIWKNKSNNNKLEVIFSNIISREEKSNRLAIVELNERNERIVKEDKLLQHSITLAKSYGTIYDEMTEEEQYQLITFVNLMNASTQLLTNPILSFVPKCTDEILTSYKKSGNHLHYSDYTIKYLVNLLFKINLDDSEKVLLWKHFRKNHLFLEMFKISKKEFDLGIMDEVESVLNYMKQT